MWSDSAKYLGIQLLFSAQKNPNTILNYVRQPFPWHLTGWPLRPVLMVRHLTTTALCVTPANSLKRFFYQNPQARLERWGFVSPCSVPVSFIISLSGPPSSFHKTSGVLLGLSLILKFFLRLCVHIKVEVMYVRLTKKWTFLVGICIFNMKCYLRKEKQMWELQQQLDYQMLPQAWRTWGVP